MSRDMLWWWLFYISCLVCRPTVRGGCISLYSFIFRWKARRRLAASQTHPQQGDPRGAQSFQDTFRFWKPPSKIHPKRMWRLPLDYSRMWVAKSQSGRLAWSPEVCAIAINLLPLHSAQRLQRKLCPDFLQAQQSLITFNVWLCQNIDSTP